MRVAVVGAGIVGLAVSYQLTRAGQPVDCFEAGTPMAGRSCGDTRIFRLAHDRAALVDWARQAHVVWQEWSAAAGVRLVGDQTTVASGEIDAMAAAMAAAGVPFEITDRAPSLPARRPVGPFLVDVAGGVIQAAAAGRFLTAAVGHRIIREAVTSIAIDGDTAVLATGSVSRRYDSVVVAAGAATPGLVAALGIEAPTRLVHHARTTFRLRDAGAQPPCWLDRAGAWRPGFSTYSHLVGPGLWSVGGHLADEDTRWDLGRDTAVDRAREVLTGYVRDYATGADPEVVDSLYCNVTAGLGDGLSSARIGPVIAGWGDNLFKLAPVIGRTLAEAAVRLSVPDVLASVAHPRGSSG
jgi:sarcosine oxidase